MQGLYWLFFFSGSAGLIYQVVWSRLLYQIFGVTVYAVTTVVATFLLGLALGGLALGKVADRSPRPLRLYGWLEVGIGVCCLLGVFLLGWLDPLHIRAANHYAADSWQLLGVRVGLASLVILPPTFLMGGTLPVVTRAFVRQIQGLGRQLSLLYALNTFGAVVGSLAAGFLLIRWLGLNVTLGIAVVMNLVIGLLALRLSRLIPPEAVGVARPFATRERPREEGTAASGEARRAARAQADKPGERGTGVIGGGGADFGLLLAVALSGFASLGLEVFWSRILIVIVGTTTYAFVTVLSSYLVGITLGSFLTSLFADRLGDLRRAFAWIQIGIVASVLATLWILRFLNTGTIETTLSEVGWFGLILGRFGVSFALMLVPTTLIGMTFPIAGKIWTRRIESVGGHVGQIYGANTLGNILGAAVSGFLILPWLGLQKGVAALTVLNLAAAAWGFLSSRARSRARLAAGELAPGAHRSASRRRAAIPLVMVGGAVVSCAAMIALWNPPPFVGRGEAETDQTLFYKEGIVATVKVVQRSEDAAQRWMAVDGIKIGESSGGVDMKQQVLAHFPFLLSKDPVRRVLSIGLGTGILIGESARHPEVEIVECVEISPAVIEGARCFDEFNGGIFENPKISVICDDGVNFLRRVERRYDAIISDAKSRTAHAGNALFYSQDYYRECAEHLDEDGIMIQWIPLILPPNELQTIYRTFLTAFPHVYLWFAYDACFLVGCKEALDLDPARLDGGLQAAAVSDLRDWGWTDGQSMLDFLVTDAAPLREWLGEGPLNSLQHPVLEFYAPRDYAVPPTFRQAQNMEALATLFTQATFGGVHGAATHEGGGRATVRRLMETLPRLENANLGEVQSAAHALELLMRNAPPVGVSRQIAGAAFFQLALRFGAEGRTEESIAYYRTALEHRERHAPTHNNLATALRLRGRIPEALQHYERAVELNPMYAGALLNLSSTLLMAGRIEESVRAGERAVELSPTVAAAHRQLGIALSMTHRAEAALDQLREAARLEPKSPEPWAAMARIRALHTDTSVRDLAEAHRLAKRSIELAGEDSPVGLLTLAELEAASGEFESATETSREALRIARAQGNQVQARQIEFAIAQYREKKAPPAFGR